MESTIAKTRINRNNIDILYTRLKKEYPDVLERELRRIDALLSLNRVQGTIKPNTITMEEIVNDVNDVRAKRYARNKSCL